MRRLLLRLTVIFCVVTIVRISGSASVVQNKFTEKIRDNDTQTNAVRVRCFLNEKQFKLSAAGVIGSHLHDHKHRKLDIALTTGHGLLDGTGKLIDDCYVYGPDGRKSKVLGIKLAQNYKEASSTDWGVLVFKKIKDPNLIRYSVDPSLSPPEFERLASEKADVKFSAARGILENRQDCNLYPRRYASLTDKKYDGIMPHSCHSIGGQSGTPVSVAGSQSHIVIGIHLGETFSLPIANVTDKAMWFGFMRIIDKSFLDELEAIVSEFDGAY